MHTVECLYSRPKSNQKHHVKLFRKRVWSETRDRFSKFWEPLLFSNGSGNFDLEIWNTGSEYYMINYSETGSGRTMSVIF